MQKKLKSKKIIISDVTLRDGNHAVFHQISENVIKKYCQLASKAKMEIMEVGHGNGIGASCITTGKTRVSLKKTLTLAKKNLNKTKLSVHSIPGFSTLEDINLCIDSGVDIFRIGANAPDFDICFQQIEYCKKKNKEVWAVLMMSHLLMENKNYINVVKSLINSGVDTVIFMDSAGFFLPSDIEQIFSNLRKKFKINYGFHGHNNYGCAIWNSIVAIQNGCSIIDASIKGFGAGAGNTQLEVLMTVIEKMGYKIKPLTEEFYKISDMFYSFFPQNVETKEMFVDTSNILSASNGLVSAFAPPVDFFSKKLKIDRIKAYQILGGKKLVAGQEDLIPDLLKKNK